MCSPRYAGPPIAGPSFALTRKEKRCDRLEVTDITMSLSTTPKRSGAARSSELERFQPFRTGQTRNDSCGSNVLSSAAWPLSSVLSSQAFTNR